jgi:hypothetical protein
MKQRRKNEAVSGSIISALSAIALQQSRIFDPTRRNNSHSIKIACCGIQLSAGLPVTKPTRALNYYWPPRCARAGERNWVLQKHSNTMAAFQPFQRRTLWMCAALDVWSYNVCSAELKVINREVGIVAVVVVLLLSRRHIRRVAAAPGL